jgi:GT2 family glycosyltransferase
VLPTCVKSFRRQARTAGIDAEVVVVEQSEDSAEADAVREVAADRVVVRPNRGYAAGLNAGSDVATGDVLMLANPDIEFLDDSVAALMSALDLGFDVVGPQLVWDSASRVLLPVPDDPAPAAELRRTLRRRRQGLWRMGFSAAAEASWRVWNAAGAVEVPCLRGPLMVVSRAALDRYGPFDDGYFLYYEETEWLWRARSRGARLAVAADARVVHRWGHATGQRRDAGKVEQASRRRFFSRNYSPAWRLLLRSVSGGSPSAGVAARRVDGPAAIPRYVADLWLLSIFPHLQPAIGFVGGTMAVDAIEELTSRGQWVAAAVNRRGHRWRVDGSWTWTCE